MHVIGCTPGGRFLATYQAVLVLAVYLAVTSVLTARSPLPPDVRGMMLGGALLLLLPVALIPLGSGGIRSRPVHAHRHRRCACAAAWDCVTVPGIGLYSETALH